MNFIIVSCLWKILSVTNLFCYHLPGKLGRFTLHKGFLSLHKETMLLQGVCMHTPTETHTRTRTSLTHKQYSLSGCSLSTANFPVFTKLPTSKKSDTCKVNFPLVSFPECSVIPQGFTFLCKRGSVTWAKVTTRFMAGHEH